MTGRNPPSDPRARGRHGDLSQSNSWRQPGPGQQSRGDSPSPRYPMPSGQPDGAPRYVPGTPPPPPADPRSSRGHIPSRQLPAQPRRQIGMSGPRTDPTLYEWDRLTPEQQQSVLVTLGARASKTTSPRRPVIVGLLVLVLVVAITAFLLLHGL
jgi:hypothetical protein